MADIGQPGTALELCKGAGAMIKTALNEAYGKKVGDWAAAALLGARLVWQKSGYESKKNIVTMLVVDEQPLWYGNPTYILGNKWSAKWPAVNFTREQARNPPHLSPRVPWKLTGLGVLRIGGNG